MSQMASSVVETSQVIPDDVPLPDGWHWVSLGDVCSTTSGGTPSRGVKAYYGGNIAWVKSGELNDGEIHSTEETITEDGLANSSAKLFSAGTLLIALYGATVGKLGVLGIDAATNQAVCAIFPSDSVHRDYLFYYLLRERESLLQISFGGAQPNISQDIVRSIKVALPPLPEQKRIATILKEQMAAVERARTAAEARLKAAKDLPAAYLRAVFENPEAEQWQEKKIGEVCGVTKLAGFEYTKFVKYVPDGEYIALRAQNVRNDGLDLRNVVRISSDVASSLYRSKLDRNDVVMTFIGANIGEATWIDESDTFYCAPNIAKITPNTEFVDHRFLTLAIQSQPFQNQIKEINASTAQQSLSMRDIRNFTVPVPSLDKQRRIASECLEHRAAAKILQDKLQDQLDSINELPTLLLRQAFTGKLYGKS